MYWLVVLHLMKKAAFKSELDNDK